MKTSIRDALITLSAQLDYLQDENLKRAERLALDYLRGIESAKEKALEADAERRAFGVSMDMVGSLIKQIDAGDVG